MLASSGHGYLEYAPLAVALCVALAALGFVATILAAVRGRDRAAAAPPDRARRGARAGRVRAAGADRAVRPRRPRALGARSSRRRSCSGSRRSCRSRCSRPRSRSRSRPLRAPHRRRRSQPRPRGALDRGRVSCRWPAVDLPREPVLARGYTGRGPPLPRLDEQARPSRAADRSEERWATTRAVVRAGRCSSRSPPSLAALALVPAAGAHARLMTTDPANDAVLEQSPRSVLLRFDEPVETAFGAIRVYDARARRVDSGEVERPSETEARIALDRRLARGTYTATWRVVSADGHPVSGAFVFHVGAPGREPGRDRRAGARRRNADVGVGPLLDRAGARLPPAPPRRRRHADAGRRARPRLGETRSRLARLLAGAALLLALVALDGNRAPGSGGGRLRPRRGAPLGRRLGGARHAVRHRLARAGRARGGVRGCCSLASRRVPVLARAALVPAALLAAHARRCPVTRASPAGSRSSPTSRTSPPRRSGSAASPRSSSPSSGRARSGGSSPSAPCRASPGSPSSPSRG